MRAIRLCCKWRASQKERGVTNDAKKKDKDLVAHAEAFMTLFAECAAEQKQPDKMPGLNFSYGAAGFVEMTGDLEKALSDFVHRAAKLMGAAAAHEKAISQIATKHAHVQVTKASPPKAAASALIDEVFKAGGASFVFVAPNYLVRLPPEILEVRIGRVRVMQTAAFAAERKKKYPDDAAKLVVGGGFSFGLPTAGKMYVTMLPICWVVEVDAAAENVEEEGKWLIDVAVSLLRLHHDKWQGLFPGPGDQEPHPIKVPTPHDESVKYQGSTVSFGGGKTPGWYEVDEVVSAKTIDTGFIAKAQLVSDPPAKTLAERVSQGLGWLTRGRQSADRAERLLYFFTAIEALLSSDDKTAPVVQTIARHSAVLLTNDNAARAAMASAIRKLYVFRSALVHAGNRSVFWSSANTAQIIAESLFFVVLSKADLAQPHAKLCEELSASSYGLPWPATP